MFDNDIFKRAYLQQLHLIKEDNDDVINEDGDEIDVLDDGLEETLKNWKLTQSNGWDLHHLIGKGFGLSLDDNGTGEFEIIPIKPFTIPWDVSKAELKEYLLNALPDDAKGAYIGTWAVYKPGSWTELPEQSVKIIDVREYVTKPGYTLTDDEKDFLKQKLKDYLDSHKYVDFFDKNQN